MCRLLGIRSVFVGVPPSPQTKKRPAWFSTWRAFPVIGMVSDIRTVVAERQEVAFDTCFSSIMVCSSPASNISIMMSLPPTNSPFTYSWGIVGQSE